MCQCPPGMSYVIQVETCFLETGIQECGRSFRRRGERVQGMCQRPLGMSCVIQVETCFLETGISRNLEGASGGVGKSRCGMYQCLGGIYKPTYNQTVLHINTTLLRKYCTTHYPYVENLYNTYTLRQQCTIILRNTQYKAPHINT